MSPNGCFDRNGLSRDQAVSEQGHAGAQHLLAGHQQEGREGGEVEKNQQDQEIVQWADCWLI